MKNLEFKLDQIARLIVFINESFVNFFFIFRFFATCFESSKSNENAIEIYEQERSIRLYVINVSARIE